MVIIGGGFGGLNAAKSLGQTQFEVLLIDKTNHHLFQPLLYQVATAALSPADIAVPVREVVRWKKNVSVIMGVVTSIDAKKQTIHLRNGDDYGYDFLIVAAGAKHSYFGHREWEKHAPGLKTLADALHIRERILTSFERAERCDVASEARKFLTFVIIGAGPTGVEMAGAIAEIANKTMVRNFRRIDPTQTKIYLVEGAKSVLPVYPEGLSKKAQRYLERFGVQVLTGKLVSEVTGDGVQVGDQFIETQNVIWAAGNQGMPVLKTIGADLDSQGRVIVGADLSVPGFGNLFVIGDAAHAGDGKGGLLPGLAPVAVQQGKYVAKMIKRGFPQEKRPGFRYFDRGSMATVGKTKAIGVIGGLKVSGFLAWFLWSFVHVLYLIGFRTKLFVITQWLIAYFSDRRGARLIHKSI